MALPMRRPSSTRLSATIESRGDSASSRSSTTIGGAQAGAAAGAQAGAAGAAAGGWERCLDKLRARADSVCVSVVASNAAARCCDGGGGGGGSLAAAAGTFGEAAEGDRPKLSMRLRNPAAIGRAKDGVLFRGVRAVPEPLSAATGALPLSAPMPSPVADMRFQKARLLSHVAAARSVHTPNLCIRNFR